MTIDAARKLAKKQLTPRRCRHTKEVAAAARRLALRWGASPAKAELAGWLHDIVKEWTRPELLQLLNQDDIIAETTKHRPPAIWHGPAAALYARHSLGVADEDVLSAIACHTTGKPGMSLLDKVLFLADTISDDRSFPGIDELRELAFADLDAAVVAAMEENLRYLEEKGKKLDQGTLEALRWMQSSRKGAE